VYQVKAGRKGVILAVLAGLVVAIVAIAVWRPGRPVVSDRQQILRLIAEVEQAVERKSVSGCMRYVSEAYHDESGGRRDLQRLMVGAFRTRNDVELGVYPEQVDITGPTAAVTVRVEVTSVSPEGARDTTPMVVRAKLAKEQRRWVLTQAEGYEEGAEAFD